MLNNNHSNHSLGARISQVNLPGVKRSFGKIERKRVCTEWHVRACEQMEVADTTTAREREGGLENISTHQHWIFNNGYGIIAGPTSNFFPRKKLIDPLDRWGPVPRGFTLPFPRQDISRPNRDGLCGPALARRALTSGRVYSGGSSLHIGCKSPRK